MIDISDYTFSTGCRFRDRGLSESLFQRLEGCGSCFPLHLQYRMNAEIMALSNQLIYSGALCCGNEKVAKGYLSLPDKTHIHTVMMNSEYTYLENI